MIILYRALMTRSFHCLGSPSLLLLRNIILKKIQLHVIIYDDLYLIIVNITILKTIFSCFFLSFSFICQEQSLKKNVNCLIMRQLSRFHIWLAIFNQFYFNIKQKNTLHVQQIKETILL